MLGSTKQEMFGQIMRTVSLFIIRYFLLIKIIIMSTKNFSIVDERGNINTSLLEKELVSSLAFDIKYKQTDNMKKVTV